MEDVIAKRGHELAAALVPDGGFDAGFGWTLAVADRDVLRPAVTGMDRGTVALGLAGVQRLLQGIKHEVHAHRCTSELVMKEH